MDETILVFSDSHGDPTLMRQALKTNIGASIIHLGDGIDDLSFLDTNGRQIYTVCGNFESYLYPSTTKNHDLYEKLIEVSETRILMMHGHLHSVKSSLDSAIRAATAADADLLLFGHTHTPVDIYLPEGTKVAGMILKKPLRIMNPGTAGRGAKLSYGVLTFRDGALLTSHFQK